MSQNINRKKEENVEIAKRTKKREMAKGIGRDCWTCVYMLKLDFCSD